MSNTFSIKQNDTSPSLQAICRRENGAVDLTNADSVRFHMGSLVNAAATFADRATGLVQYDWQTGDTATVGSYPVEFQVTWTDGRIETFPNTNNHPLVVITAELG